jgi:mannose-6-phosphate isomerase-like protein (cupin superfamily)
MTSIWFLHQLADILVEGDDYALIEMLTPAGDQPPLHVHDDEDEGFYVLEGELCLWVGTERTVLRPGQFANAPKGVPHTYRVTSEQRGRYLVTSPTGGFARFVRAVGEPAPRRELPPADAPVDPERLARIAAEHRITLLGPPGMLPTDLPGAQAA